MISIEVLGKPCSGAKKTLGWDNSQKSFKNNFKNLGVVSTSLKCFLNDFGTNGHLGYGRNELVVHKKHWCFFVVARSNYPMQPHYPGVG
jgi:hypothetical protein